MFHKKYLKVNFKNGIFYKWCSIGSREYVLLKGTFQYNNGVPLKNHRLSFLTTNKLADIDCSGHIMSYKEEELNFNEILDESEEIFLNFEECVQSLYQELLKKFGESSSSNFLRNIKNLERR